MSEASEGNPQDETKPELEGIDELGDVNPDIRAVQGLDPMGFAEEVVKDVKGEIIESVIEENPYADMDELNDEVQDTIRKAHLGVGLMAVQAAAQAQKEAYLETDDMYSGYPLEEMRRLLSEEGFKQVYREDFAIDDPILLGDEEYPHPGGVYEIWFNQEGALVTFDAGPDMDYSSGEPFLFGHKVNSATLHYNWVPDPRTFVYHSDEAERLGVDRDQHEPTPEWRAHVDAHHYSRFTSSGHFLTVSDEEWEDKSKRVWVGSHQLVSGGLRYALQNLRRNGSLLPEWREAPLTTAFGHFGDTRRTADYRYKEHPEALVAARDQVQMQVRARYEALPEEVKKCIGAFHSWEDKMKPKLETELPSLDYLADEPDGPDLSRG